MKPTKDRILILCRNSGRRSIALRNVLQDLGEVDIITDKNPQKRCEKTFWYPDDILSGFEGIMSNTQYFPDFTAWSRAIYHLEQTGNPSERVWFVEDDVAGDRESFTDLFTQVREDKPDYASLAILTKREGEKWHWWQYYEDFFDDPYHSFQPLCCVSFKMVDEILHYRKTQGRLLFHEILFPSLAIQKKMQIMDWTQIPACRRCFSVFRYRPEFIPDGPGICHPVKDEEALVSLCRS